MFVVFLGYSFLVTSYMLCEENTGGEFPWFLEWTNVLEEHTTIVSNVTGNMNTSIGHISPHQMEGYSVINVSVKVLLHFIIFLFSIGFHVEAVYENSYLGFRCFCQTLLLSPTRIIFLLRFANCFKISLINNVFYSQLLDGRNLLPDKSCTSRTAQYSSLSDCFNSFWNLALPTFLL